MNGQETHHVQRYDMLSPVEYPPQRVISLVPSITESLFDLNLGHRLVAVTDYCIHPQQGVASLPRVGGRKDPDIERIVALQPDLVIVNQEENRKEDAERLAAAGIPVWVTHPRTVQEALNLLWEIMYIFDEPSRSEGVRWIERQVDWMQSAAKESSPTRVFVPIWCDPWMTFNEQTYIHDLLRVCGGENVFATRERRYPLQADLGEVEPLPPGDPRIAGRDTRYPRITLDEVVAAQPEVILLPDEPYAFTRSHIERLAGLDMPAARQGRIHQVDGTLLTWPGTRLARALREIPPLLVKDNEE